MDLNSRLGIYNVFISSQFKYCPLIRHFCGKNLSDKLEKLQIRALRFVYQDLNSKTEDLIAKSHHSSLQPKEYASIQDSFYNISPNIVSDIFQLKKSRYTSRKIKPLEIHEIPHVKPVRYGINSFRYQGSKIWNELPNDIKNATDLNLLKNMTYWNGHTCNCDICTLSF